jgi:hypothetical protein
MDGEREANRRRRLVFIVSGLTDMVIGVAIVMVGLGLLPVDLDGFGLPSWMVLLVGAILAFAGAAVTFYNFSRLDE